MVQSNLKLCWMHPKSSSRLNKTPCEHSTDYDGANIPICHDGCQYYMRCKRVFEMGQFPNKFWDLPKNFKPDISDYNALAITQQIRKNVQSFVDNGQNMLIYSNTHGNGKTLRSVSIANTFISHSCMLDIFSENIVRYAYIPKIVSDYGIYDKFSYENTSRQFFYEFLESLNTSRLVVWDDFGFHSESRIESVIIRSIINYRINEGLSNIFVATKSLQELSNCVGIYDWNRIKESSIIVEFTGPDKRTTEWGDSVE